MSDPSLSDFDLKNKIAWVWISLKTRQFCLKFVQNDHVFGRISNRTLKFEEMLWPVFYFCVGMQSQRQSCHVTNQWMDWCLYRIPSAYPDGVWVARRYLSWNKFSIWIHFMVFDYTQMERPVSSLNIWRIITIYTVIYHHLTSNRPIFWKFWAKIDSNWLLMGWITEINGLRNQNWSN